ncbi:MAG: hypothetical protein OXD31_09405 [Chloroflexi bacterium]|nr:hypothetical protein [Chloroflexota bacterium]
MTGEHIPELLLSEELNAKVNGHGILAWFVLFEILFDPEPDDVFKHEFATLGGTIIYSDGEWIISYSLFDSGDIQISNMVRDTYP